MRIKKLSDLLMSIYVKMFDGDGLFCLPSNFKKFVGLNFYKVILLTVKFLHGVVIRFWLQS